MKKIFAAFMFACVMACGFSSCIVEERGYGYGYHHHYNHYHHYHHQPERIIIR